MKRRFSEEQIIGILREQEAGGAVKEITRRHRDLGAKLLPLEGQVGGMEVSEAGVCGSSRRRTGSSSGFWLRRIWTTRR